jgi:Mu-like prophage I protein
MALTLNDDQAAALLDMLGLPPDTTDVDTVLATIKDLVTDEQGEGDDMTKPSAVAAAAKRAGLEVVDASTLQLLQRDAAEGRTLKASVEQQRVEAAVDDAISKGKITAARRKHWVSLIGADPGMADVLAGVPNETAVPMTEVGHGVDSESGELAPAEWFR